MRDVLRLVDVGFDVSEPTRSAQERDLRTWSPRPPPSALAQRVSEERASESPARSRDSFAGEERVYVEMVARGLKERGLRVFYDEDEKVKVWGKDLAEHFDRIYRTASRYCVMFVSAAYAAKPWTRHERRSALARALIAEGEYVLPARFDDTELPGLRPTVAWLDLRDIAPATLVEFVLEKTGLNAPSRTSPRRIHPAGMNRAVPRRLHTLGSPPALPDVAPVPRWNPGCHNRACGLLPGSPPTTRQSEGFSGCRPADWRRRWTTEPSASRPRRHQPMVAICCGIGLKVCWVRRTETINPGATAYRWTARGLLSVKFRKRPSPIRRASRERAKRARPRDACQRRLKMEQESPVENGAAQRSFSPVSTSSRLPRRR